MIARLVISHLLCNKRDFVNNFVRRMASRTAGTRDEYESVINFWFPENKTLDEKFKFWFAGGPEADNLIKEKFGTLISQARDGELSHWEDLSEGNNAAFAFIILIDQFCRSIYRGTANQFSHDGKALAVAQKLVEGENYKEFPLLHRIFIYLPFEHSENLDHQKRSVELYRGLADEASPDLSDFTKLTVQFAEEHHEVIRKFGRFPGRNAALSRESTPEEIEILKNWPYKF